MNTSKHTPGPWRVEERDRMGLLTIYAPSSNIVVAEIEEHHVSVTDSFADARLIAAAPELLAMLREIVAIAECDDTDARELVMYMTKYVRAALAKAGAL